MRSAKTKLIFLVLVGVLFAFMLSIPITRADPIIPHFLYMNLSHYNLSNGTWYLYVIPLSTLTPNNQSIFLNSFNASKTDYIEAKALCGLNSEFIYTYTDGPEPIMYSIIKPFAKNPKCLPYFPHAAANATMVSNPPPGVEPSNIVYIDNGSFFAGSEVEGFSYYNLYLPPHPYYNTFATSLYYSTPVYFELTTNGSIPTYEFDYGSSGSNEYIFILERINSTNDIYFSEPTSIWNQNILATSGAYDVQLSQLKLEPNNLLLIGFTKVGSGGVATSNNYYPYLIFPVIAITLIILVLWRRRKK